MANNGNNGKKVEDYSKEELIELVKDLKKRKKFGIVWEAKPEDVVDQCKRELPVLKEVESLAIEKAPNQGTNLIIEGDNYHALSVLNYTHAGKIDVIYIDPPYNTGSADWKYNNDYIDINDMYRHSKWLSMMYSRLVLAKNLLTKKGVLICTIDSNEQENLGIILRELFPSHEIAPIVIVHNPAGVQGKNFSYTHEFAYFVYPDDGKYISDTTRDNDLVSPLRDWGTISLRSQAKTCFYPIFIKAGKIVAFGDVSKSTFHPKSPNIKMKDGTIAVYPVDKHGIERKWVYSRASAERNVDQLSCKKIGDEWVIMRTKSLFVRRTVWDDTKYYANIYGSKLLNAIINVKFPFPKSLFAVQDCISAAIHDKDSAIILDFFAGSGTTGHAVMNLNKIDGGSRRFILCTNNENKIAEEVTYPRIKNVIRGVKKLPDITGIPANVRYFKTDFVPKDEVSDNTRRTLVARSTEMICVREDTFGKQYDNKQFKIYTNGKVATGILFDLDALEDFKEKLDTLKMPAHLYVFSLSNDVFADDFSDLSVKHNLCPIPESILEVYRKIFA